MTGSIPLSLIPEMSFKAPPEQEIYELFSDFNNRPDHLIAIIKQRLKIKGELGYLHLAQVDPDGKWAKVYYHPPPDHKEVELLIPFDPPAKSYREMKEQIYNWRKDAIDHFRPPKYPIIDYYSSPTLFPYTAPLAILLSILLFALFGWGDYADLFRTKIVQKLGKHTLPAAGIFAGIMHLFLEPAHMVSQLRKHDTPFSAGWKWVLTVVLFGFAGLNEWAECLEHERIRYIYTKTDVGQIGPKNKTAVTQEKKDL